MVLLPTPVPRDVEVIVPTLSWRYSGVTSTVRALLPLQAAALRIGALNSPLDDRGLELGLLGTLRAVFSPVPKSRPFRIWHTRRNVETIIGLLLQRIVGRNRLRMVFTSASQREHTWITRYLLSKVDAIIATSAAGASYLYHPSIVIPHGIDPDRFAPAADRKAAWHALGLKGEAGIGCFGRIRHQKGTDVFVDAMIDLLPRHPNFSAVVAGETVPSEIAYLEKLKARVAAAGLADRIHFVGLVSAADMPRWLAAMTLVVSPQRHEGFGLVPLEAMASGAPVIATRVGAAADLVADGETGAVIAPGDIAAMAQATEPYLADAARCDAAAKAARSRALSFSLAEEARRIIMVYEALWQNNLNQIVTHPGRFAKSG